MKAKSKVSAWPEVRRSSGRQEMEQRDTVQLSRALSLEQLGIGTTGESAFPYLTFAELAVCGDRFFAPLLPADRNPEKSTVKIAARRLSEALGSLHRSKPHLVPEGLADVSVLFADVTRHQHAVVGQRQRDAQRVVARVHSCRKNNTSC